MKRADLILGAALLGIAGYLTLSLPSSPESHPYIALDGDTIRTGVGPDIRLARIDTAELPGHCRRARRCAPGNPFEQRALLQTKLNTGPLICTDLGSGGYGRRLAECSVNGDNLSDYMLRHGAVEYGGP